MDLEPNGKGPARRGSFGGGRGRTVPPGVTVSSLPPPLPRGAAGAAECAGRRVREPEGGLTRPGPHPASPNIACVCTLWSEPLSCCPGARRDCLPSGALALGPVSPRAAPPTPRLAGAGGGAAGLQARAYAPPSPCRASSGLRGQSLPPEASLRALPPTAHLASPCPHWQVDTLWPPLSRLFLPEPRRQRPLRRQVDELSKVLLTLDSSQEQSSALGQGRDRGVVLRPKLWEAISEL